MHSAMLWSICFFSCNAICRVTDRKSISSCSHSMFPLVGSLVPLMRHQQYVCRLMVIRDEASSQDSTRGLIAEQLIQQLVRDAVFHPDYQMTSFSWSFVSRVMFVVIFTSGLKQLLINPAMRLADHLNISKTTLQSSLHFFFKLPKCDIHSQ